METPHTQGRGKCTSQYYPPTLSLVRPSGFLYPVVSSRKCLVSEFRCADGDGEWGGLRAWAALQTSRHHLYFSTERTGKHTGNKELDIARRETKNEDISLLKQTQLWTSSLPPWGSMCNSVKWGNNTLAVLGWGQRSCLHGSPQPGCGPREHLVRVCPWSIAEQPSSELWQKQPLDNIILISWIPALGQSWPQPLRKLSLSPFTDKETDSSEWMGDTPQLT